MKGFGIDFGTTNSIVAFFNPDLGGLRAFYYSADFVDSKPHPSLALYRPDSPKPIVGWDARRQMHGIQNEMGFRFVHSVKRLMADEREVSIIGAERKPAYEVGADILASLIEHARQTDPVAAADLTSCVMTVPVYSSGKYRRALRRAAEQAGLQIQTFTHEPFAAVFGWFYSRNADFRNLPNQKVLVFDWGGGTLDITLVQVQDGRIFELGNAALSDCAGDEFTDRLTGLALDKFLARTSLNVNQVVLEAKTKDRVWVNVEDAKIKLSSDKSTVLNVPNYTANNGTLHDLNEHIVRDEYEQRILSAVDAAKAKVHECLRRAGVESPLVDLVLLIGGTSRTPLVQRMMHEIFVTKVAAVPDADAVIAKGAALISAHNWKPYLAKPITVKLADDSYLPIFEHGQPLAAPIAQKRFTFYCTDWRNNAAQFLFYEQQNPRDTASQKTLNCNMVVPTSPSVRHVSELDRIIVSCSVTEDLTIRIEAQSSSIGPPAKSIEIQDICYGLKIN